MQAFQVKAKVLLNRMPDINVGFSTANHFLFFFSFIKLRRYTRLAVLKLSTSVLSPRGLKGKCVDE